jgi:hypothetical protein
MKKRVKYILEIILVLLLIFLFSVVGSLYNFFNNELQNKKLIESQNLNKAKNNLPLKYSAKVMQLGGVGSDMVFIYVYENDIKKKLSPVEDWVGYFHNSTGELLWVVCNDSYKMTACRGGAPYDTNETPFSCGMATGKGDKREVWMTIECLKK